MAISTETHRQIAAEVGAKIEELRVQMQELEAVRRFHLLGAESPGRANGRVVHPVTATKSSKPSELDLSTSWHDAAEFAIKGLGESAKIGEMVTFLAEHDFPQGYTRRRVFNALYVALKRRKDMFEQFGDARWRLKNQPKSEQ